MTKTLEAIFDGKVFLPDEPLELAPDTRVRITIEAADEPSAPAAASFLQTARALNLDGPRIGLRVLKNISTIESATT